MKTKGIAILIGAAFLAASPLSAKEEKHWSSWHLQWENDAYAAFSGSDEHYTNGIRFGWVVDPAASEKRDHYHRFATRLCERTKFCGQFTDEDSGTLEAVTPSAHWGGFIGQNFYTPERLDVVELIGTDRPYAAYLYGAFGLSIQTDTHSNPKKNRPIQNYYELQVGIIGPEAGGEWAQKWVHELIDDEEPLGWDNQLGFEPAIELVYQWRRRYGGTRWDITPNLGYALGNVAIYANTGLTLRLGYNISSFPLLVLGPTAVSLDRPKWEAYGFLGAEGRAVAHNIFLDGNTFRDSHSVDKETWVYDLKAGFLVRWKKYQLNYTFVRRSLEFRPNFDDDGRHDFGSVTFTYSRDF